MRRGPTLHGRRRVGSRPVILFNETIDAANRQALAQIFAWAVRELDDRECELSVMASEPLGFLPAVIQRLVLMYGGRSTLVGIRKLYTP
jgi:hypothetical protein